MVPLHISSELQRHHCSSYEIVMNSTKRHACADHTLLVAPDRLRHAPPMSLVPLSFRCSACRRRLAAVHMLSQHTVFLLLLPTTPLPLSCRSHQAAPTFSSGTPQRRGMPSTWR